MKLSNARKIIPGYFENSLLTIFIKGSKKILYQIECLGKGENFGVCIYSLKYFIFQPNQIKWTS